jgi:phosphatidylglycerophosphate synthase
MSGETSESVKGDRRPLASRDKGWAKVSARIAARFLTPNQISILSMVFAALGGVLMLLGGPWWVWIVAAVCVQLRLACNLIDGMVAIEGGKASPVGAIYNEFPDRIGDTLLLVPLGYAAGIGWLGWALALAVVMTAYIRATGAALTHLGDFSGVMSKPRRMAALTVALIVEAGEVSWTGTVWSLRIAAVVILLGTLWTCWTRTQALAQRLTQA